MTADSRRAVGTAMVTAMMRGLAILVMLAVALAGAAVAATPLPAEIEARIASVTQSPNPDAISAAVIEAIEARPDQVEAIVVRTARAAPAYSVRIAGDAARAFPAFAPRIAAAASTATPEQAQVIVKVTSDPAVGVSRSSVTRAVEATPAVDTLERSDWKARLALGVGAHFYRTPNMPGGVRLTVDNGRDNDLDRLLAGTRTVDPELELGLYFEFYSGPWNLGADIRQGVGLDDNRHEGFLGELHVAYAARIGRVERIFAGVTTTYAGPSYMRTYFNSGAFNANEGLRDVGVFLTVEHDLSRHIFARLVGRGQRLLFDAADSPVTDKDSKNQFYAAIQLG
ncbi:MAG: MipA/OmpV family protein [Alphaproteobacteria bacterium]|nr:MipA/OmpV family protein [Alphaproteobacteria bacterium]